MSKNRLLSYCIYLMTFSFVCSFLWVLSGVVISKFKGFSLDSPFSLLACHVPYIVPYVIIQVIFAARFARNISLKKLFIITIFLRTIGHLIISNVNLYQNSFIWKYDNFVFTAFKLFIYLIPVFVLKLACSKRTVLNSEMEVDSENNLEKTKPEVANGSKDYSINEKKWYRYDKQLILFVLVYGVLIYLDCLLFYLSGLYNSMFFSFILFMMIPICPVFLVSKYLMSIPIFICVFILIIRMFSIWPKHISDRKSLITNYLVCTCFFGFLIYLPFTLQDVPGYKIQMKGFRNYVQANVDVPAIRKWLQTLDPNDCVEIQYSDGYTITEPKRTGLKQVPFAIKQIGYFWLSLDRNNNPMIRFHWGSGMAGTWGFVIGKEGMAISDSVPFWGMAIRNEEILDSEAESTEEYEYRNIAQDGVYIFHDL